jgi:hypothetical protein
MAKPRIMLSEVVRREERRIRRMFPPGTLDLVSIVPDQATGYVVVIFRVSKKSEGA